MSKWRIVDTWNRGTNIPKVVFVTKSEDDNQAQDEMFKWILENTPWSNQEAERQGYKKEKVPSTP